MITTDPDTGPVERSSLVKGYAVEKNSTGPKTGTPSSESIWLG
jgi:hypothetical protein